MFFGAVFVLEQHEKHVVAWLKGSHSVKLKGKQGQG